MQEVGDEYYNLQYGIQMRFKDKSAKFLVPMKQFADIAQLSRVLPRYIEFAYILPLEAQEKKRHFKRGANVEEFCEYLEMQDVLLSDCQKEYLHKLSQEEKLRLYHEVLQTKGRKMVRAYFLNIRRVSAIQKHDILERLFHFFNSSEEICCE